MSDEKTLHVELDADDAERFDALRNDDETISNCVRRLIRDAYDADDSIDGYVYDVRESRDKPLSTEDIKDILWRYDAPAINPDHIMTWPRNQKEKTEVLAAVARYHDADTLEDVEWVISTTIGEGSNSGRNLREYKDPVTELVNPKKGGTPLAGADNVPPINSVNSKSIRRKYDSLQEWMSKAKGLIGLDADAKEAVGPNPFSKAASEGRQFVSVMDGHSRKEEVVGISEDLEKISRVME